MTKTTRTYYCDICGKEIELGETGIHFNGAKHFPHMRPFLDCNGDKMLKRRDDFEVYDICEECHDKIANFITSLRPEEYRA